MKTTAEIWTLKLRAGVGGVHILSCSWSLPIHDFRFLFSIAYLLHSSDVSSFRVRLVRQANGGWIWFCRCWDVLLERLEKALLRTLQQQNEIYPLLQAPLKYRPPTRTQLRNGSGILAPGLRAAAFYSYSIQSLASTRFHTRSSDADSFHILFVFGVSSRCQVEMFP